VDCWDATVMDWCSGAHDTSGVTAPFSHLQLIRTALHPLNLRKNSFYDCVGVKYKKMKFEILIRKLE